MRASLAESLATQRAADMQYVAGSVVLCCACLKPLYVLQRSIFSGDKASATVDAYRPVTVADLDALARRIDHPGVAAMVRQWPLAARHAHIARIPELRTGSPALCPCCDRSWVQVRAVEAAEVLDRAYVWELVTILPDRPVAEGVARAWLIPPPSTH